MKTILCLITFLFLSGCLISQPKKAPLPEKLTVELSGPTKQNDSIEISVEDDTTVFDIRSRSGIGASKISPSPAGWPAKLTFRLHLRGIESFIVDNGLVVVNSYVQSTAPYMSLNSIKHKGKRESAITASSPYWMPVEVISETGKTNLIPLQSGYFEVKVADITLKNNPNSLFIHWVDFYR